VLQGGSWYAKFGSRTGGPVYTSSAFAQRSLNDCFLLSRKLLKTAEWFRKAGPQEVVRTLADCFLGRPSVQLSSAPIPVGDDVVPIGDENGVVCEVQQAGLPGTFRDLDLQAVASFTKFYLDASSKGAEPGYQRRECGENNKVRQIGSEMLS
jgi:hypothetical protein